LPSFWERFHKVPRSLRYLVLVGLVCGLGYYLYSAVRSANTKGGIAFVANQTGNWELFVVQEDGSGLTQLTESDLDARAPAFSPDGKQLAYVTSDGALAVMALGNKETTTLALPTGRYGHPTWLSDGSGLVFTAYAVTPPTEDADFQLWSFAEQKARPFLVQTGPQDYPALSPVGDQIAYISSIMTMVPGMGSSVTQQLWVTSLREGKPRQLLLGSAQDNRPAWSPDGKQLVFSSDRRGNPDLWLIQVETQETTQLTDTAAAEAGPAWSPDGKKVVYVAQDGEQSQLMMLDVATKQSKKLAPFGEKPVAIREPSWR
jgi:TolB protein